MGNAELLRLTGVVNVQQPGEENSKVIAGIPLNFGPFVVLRPSFGVTIQEIRTKLADVKISTRSTVILSGDINLRHVNIDGSYEFHGSGTVSQQNLQGTGDHAFIHVHAQSDLQAEYLKIRGYDFKNVSSLLRITAPNPSL
eukprot:TRINITY_DN7778_c0_g1_i2.p1 TRINITY_DN7778_c0_g1~~TRINITY_DN7778_c0_g1_i2.p1  ORF type:complete len:141 (+),score=36.15 TRINITY_DN7778_c0_g1_i2:39-461(+)